LVRSFDPEANSAKVAKVPRFSLSTFPDWDYAQAMVVMCCCLLARCAAREQGELIGVRQRADVLEALGVNIHLGPEVLPHT
jgi:hypothetical protein